MPEQPWKPAHLDLFSGIGGFALAASCAGFTTVQFVEIDGFCQRVLRRHWPDVPIHDDIRTFSARSLGPIALVTGGFPCQPVSVAGKRGGQADDRWLWPEMARVIAECRPRWVVGENVAGIINLGLDACLSDLERLGYEAWSLVLPACAVNAPHRRDRVWIVACAGVVADAGSGKGESRPHPEVFWGRAEHAEQIGVGGSQPPGAGSASARAAQPGVRGVSDGLPGGLDGCGLRQQLPAWAGGEWEQPPPLSGLRSGHAARLRALGNAIVPQVAARILAAIRDIDPAFRSAGEAGDA